MSGGRFAALASARCPNPDGSRFVPKVNETLPDARLRLAHEELARRAGQRARLASLRRSLLAQAFLDRERRVGPADEVLTAAPG